MQERGFVGFAFSADHGDAAGADELQDAVGAHAADKGFNFAFATGDFNHQFLFADIHDAAAENIDKLPDFRPLGTGRACLWSRSLVLCSQNNGWRHAHSFWLIVFV